MIISFPNKNFYIIVLLLFVFQISNAQKIIPLYPEGAIPYYKTNAPEEIRDTAANGSIRVTNISIPTLQIYQAKSRKSTAAILIFPGGAYLKLGVNFGGSGIATALNELGITAIVVKYRLPDSVIVQHPEIVPFLDARRAMEVVKAHASEWNINPDYIGVLGLSAGGHLASSLSTSFLHTNIDTLSVNTVKPKFMVLLYPVISFKKGIRNGATYQSLLGRYNLENKIAEYSNENFVTKETAPAILFHSVDDSSVTYKSSMIFFDSLAHYNSPSELHIYPRGGHGFSLNIPGVQDKWIERCYNWMLSNKFIPNK